MRALVAPEPGRLVVDEVPEPPLEPGRVLVSTRVTAVVSDLLRERQHRETVAAPDSVDDVAAALGDSATIRHNGEISA